MTNWEPLGGDPAPGSLVAVSGVVSTLNQVARQAVDARRVLNRDAVVLDSWQGEAADAFRQRATELPQQLGDVITSFVSAEETLNRWHKTLEDAQRRARQLAQQAIQAEARQESAEARRREAEDNKTIARNRQRQAEGLAAGLRRQLALAADPAAQTSLRQRLAGQQTAARRAGHTASVEQQNSDRHRTAAKEAGSDLDRAREAARKLTGELNDAAGRTARELAQAIRLGNVKTGLQRFTENVRDATVQFGEDARDFIVQYGPAIASVMQFGAEVLSIVGLIVPQARFAAIVLSAVAFGINLLARTLDDDGLTTEDQLALTRHLLDTVLVAVPGVTKGQKTLRTGLDVTEKVVGAGEAYVRGGWDEVLSYGTGVAVSKGLQIAGPKIVARARKSPAVQKGLRNISGTVRTWGVNGTQVAGVTMTEHRSRMIRTILTNPDNPPGTFLLGRTGTGLIDHSVSQAGNDKARLIIDRGVDLGADKIGDFMGRPTAQLFFTDHREEGCDDGTPNPTP